MLEKDRAKSFIDEIGLPVTRFARCVDDKVLAARHVHRQRLRTKIHLQCGAEPVVVVFHLQSP